MTVSGCRMDGKQLHVNGCTDASTVTPLWFGKRQPGEVPSPLIGRTFTFKGSYLEPAPPDPEREKADAAFDAWATKRDEARSAAMHEVMQDTGLSEPEPRGPGGYGGEGNLLPVQALWDLLDADEWLGCGACGG